VKALRVGANGAAVDDRADAPSPGPGEALVKPALSALDPADAALASAASEGSYTPGRAFVGTVEMVEPPAGAAAELMRRRVVASPDIICGECDMCRSGLRAHCRERTCLGTPARDGAAAEFVVIPGVNLFAVPDGVTDEAAVMTVTLARAVHAASLVRVEGRPYITVLGRGVEALLAAQVMGRLNASVRVVSSCGATLGACERTGLRHRPEADVGRRADQDVVCCGAADLATATRMVRPRGSVILVEGPNGDAAGLNEALRMTVERELTLHGSRGARIGEALALLERGDVSAEGLVTGRFRLDHAVEALRAAGSPEQLGVVVEV